MVTNTKLTLIGTSHVDIDGYDRLTKLLNYLNPEIIGIEKSEKDFLITKNLTKILVQTEIFNLAVKKTLDKFPNANPETVKQFMSAFNYENNAISNYSDLKQTPIIYCNKIEKNIEMKQRDSSLNVSVENFLKLAPKEARDNVKKEYELSKYPVKDIDQTKIYQTRNKYTEKILRRQTKYMVYVCGLEQIYGDYHPNLFDRLSDLNPQRMKLNEADKL